MLRNSSLQRPSATPSTLRRTSPSNSTGNLPEAISNSSAAAASSDLARKRQSKKDDALRRKLDQELGRKQSSTKAHGSTKPIHGTVGSLRPSQALTLLDSSMIVDAARIMAAKRVDAALVVDRDSNLVGIMTDKDLAFRVVAEGLDVRSTLVSQIMTKNPFCVTTDTNATEALNTMVNGGFRHLPCLDGEGDVVGLLDITKCLYEALEKLDKAHKSSKQLVDALEGIQSEWVKGANPELQSYVDVMREKMASPDIATILEENHGVAEIQAKTSVREATKIMRQCHATASLITEDGRITGILTTKDIVVRVLAAGQEPDRTSVIRVMTPHPDTVPCSMTILDALKKMHNNHYLHLPVVDEQGQMAGLVDVLQVSLAMLRQMNTIQGDNATDGPVWNKFWESSFAKEDTGSEVSASDMRSTMIPPSEMMSPYSSSMTGIQNGSVGMDFPPSLSPISSPDDVGTEFVFKFKDNGGQVHRFASSTRSFKELYDKVSEKMGSKDVILSYCDEESDQVLIVQDSDVIDAARMAFRNRWSLIRLSVAETGNNKNKKGGSGSNMTSHDTILLAGGVGLGLGVGIALVFALMRNATEWISALVIPESFSEQLPNYHCHPPCGLKSSFPPLKNDLIIRAARGEETERIPVWIMGQTCQYLPECSEMISKHGLQSILKSPELATKLALHPLNRFGGLIDAVIIFSDILVIPRALGLEVEMSPGNELYFPNPLRDPLDMHLRLKRRVDVHTELQYVFETVSMTRHALEGRVPLIGFVGGPWTLMAYMIEGTGNRMLSKAKRWIHMYPEESNELLQRITDICVDTLIAQVHAGAQIIQVVDSFAGDLCPRDFDLFSLPFLTQIVQRVKTELDSDAVPMIIFARGVWHSLESLSNIGYDIVSLDWTLDPKDAIDIVDNRVTLQGNLDPCVLMGPDIEIIAETKKMIRMFGSTSRYISSLGSSVLSSTRVDSVRLFLETVLGS
ncbi:hypothetical protein BGZ76_005013 [Entomortierella beljakovae]|nr:hypothetical protein BGZ76_005013 [Entomortierella beljakovae]